MNRSRAARLALMALILLAAFALRLYRLDAQDIWWDEARNIDVASRPLTQIAAAPELDIHPPVYFYLLHGWLGLSRVLSASKGAAEGLNAAGQSAFAIRFLSTWFGVLLVPLMYALGRRAGGWWVGLGAALGAAFLPFLLGEAQEARMYTVTLVWLAAAGLAISDFRFRIGSSDSHSEIENRKSKIANWGLFALFSALALLTHYAAVFALIALWGWAALWALIDPCGDGPDGPPDRASHPARLPHSSRSSRFASFARLRAFALQSPTASRWPRVRALLLAGLLTGVLCLPGLPVALRQIPSYRNPNLTVPTVAAYLAELARVYGLGEHIDPSAARPWQALLAVIVGGGLLLALWNLLRSQRPATCDLRPATCDLRPAICHLPFAIFALLWAILPLIIYYLVIRDRATFAGRYICFALPGWLLLAGYALRGWASLPVFRTNIVAALAALAFVVALTPGLRGDLTDPRFFREDTRGLVTWLQANTGPNDLILVDQRYPFGFYYERWNNAADGFPPATPTELAPAQYLFVDINTVADRLTALVAGHTRVFGVRWFESDTDPRGAAPFLLEKFGTPLGERALRGYTVTWYVVAPDTQFELAPALPARAVEFGDQVRLTAVAFGGRGEGLTSTLAETRAAQAPADQLVWAAGRWARLPAARGSLKATLVLEDADGVVVGRDDRPILNDRHLAPAHWSEADAPLGVYLVRPDPATPPGVYTLKLAVYDPATLAQLPAIGAAAQGGFVALGQVTLTRAVRPPAVTQLPLAAQVDLAWGGVRLLGRGPLPEAVAPGDQLGLDLFWRAERAGLADLRVRLALIAADGAIWGAADAAPVGGRYPTGAWAAGEVVRDHRRWQIDPQTPNGAYRVEVSLVDPASGQVSPSVTLGQIAVAGRPHVFTPPAVMAGYSGARIGDFARLLGYDLAIPGFSEKPGVSPGAELALTLYWHAEGPSVIAYTVSAQLLDGNGTLRVQADHPPGAGAFPTTGWIAGEVLSDTYRLALPTDLAPGAYTLLVSMYDPATLTRLPITAADGTPAGDAVLLTTVEVR